MNDRSNGDGALAFQTAGELREYLRWSPGRRPSILAHRGAPDREHPENCIETFERALSAAPCWIEIDIRKTVDGALVLNHDSKLDRCTTGAGALAERTFDDLRRLHLKDLDGRATAWRMPTLAEAIDWARGRTVLFLDIKQGPEQYEEVLRFVRGRGAEKFAVTLTYCIEDTLAVHCIDPEACVYGRATNEAFAAELLGSGIPHDRLVAWIHDETPPEVFDRLHGEGILTTYGTFLEVDRRAAGEGLGLYHERLAKGADILNSDNVPQAAAAIETFLGDRA